ncbi:MAG TPA: amidohydrolase family protein [Polyangiaceae bacterium]|nr:amidohydrolase family protein [Polyangiaceae bacterium]
MTLHFCAPQRIPVRAPERVNRVGGGARARHLLVDFHCHVLTLAAEALVADRVEKRSEPAHMLAAIGADSLAHNNSVMLPKAFPKLTRVEQRLADMDAMSIDMQVISPSPSQYYYWADPDLARQLVRTQNEYIAQTCAQYPDRLVGLGTVALQHPSLAVEQLSDATRRLGLKGVEISTAVNDLELAAPELAPFWAAAEELGAIVFIHPFGTTLGRRVSTYYLSNLIGQPLETTIALSHLIFGGVLDRYPGLKIVAAHGGGYLPSYCGRSNHGYEVRPEARRHAARPPVEYLRRIWFDTLVYEPHGLRHLIDVVGASQLVVGTDYPFDMGHDDPRGLLAATAGLSDEERAAILAGNALSLLGMNA